jgi:succinate-acetate transporter protein
LTVRAEEAAPLGLSGAAVTVVVSSELRIEVAELDATSAAWVAALVKSLGEVGP